MLKKRLNRDEFKFIGVKSFEQKERENILDGYDDYQIKKLEFLNLYYSNQSTQLSYFNNYINNLHDYEVQKNKDLMHFTSEEIESAIKACVWSLGTTKNGLLVFVKKYCAWGEKVLHEISINPCDSIIDTVVAKSSKVLLSQKLLPLNRLYKQLVQMELEKESPLNFITVLLSRYGISGEGLDIMRNLKWWDIDRENMLVNVKNKEGLITSVIPIDEQFLFWLDKVQHTENDTYVVSKSGSGSGKPLAYASVYTRIRLSFASIEAKQYGFKDLLLSRQIELLLQIRKKRQLNRNDIGAVCDMFTERVVDKYKYAKVFHLVKKYEELTDDKILVINRGKNIMNPDDICKESPEKVVARIVKDINFDISDTDDLDVEYIIKLNSEYSKNKILDNDGLENEIIEEEDN